MILLVTDMVLKLHIFDYLLDSELQVDFLMTGGSPSFMFCKYNKGCPCWSGIISPNLC